MSNQPPKINPVTPPPTPAIPTAEEIRQEAVTARIKDERDRLRASILALRKQVHNPSVLDDFLSCLTPATSVDGRMPFTPRPVITVVDRQMLLHNILGHAIIKWGRLARGEANETNPELVQLEQVAATGFTQYGAYPRDKNGVIRTLRTVAEERAIRKQWAEAAEKALERKAAIREQREDGAPDETDTGVS